MDDQTFHMRFRDVVSVTLLFAALEKTFPLFLRTAPNESVESGGKNTREELFLTLKNFSTSFPHQPVEREH